MNTPRKSRLRLFVWTEFSPDYTGGLAVAIAKDEDDAKAQITSARGYDVYTWGDLTIHPLSRRFATSVSGGS